MNRLIFVLIILMGSLLFAQVPDTLETDNYKGKKAVLFDINNMVIRSSLWD